MTYQHSIVVINDIRVIPLIVALVLRKNNSDLVASERIFENNDYGDYYHKTYRFLIKIILVFLFNLNLIKKYNNTKLNEKEKLGLLSTLYSITCDSSADSEKYPKEYQWAYQNSLGAKEISEYIESKNYKKAFIFNGRTASSYNISRLQIANNIKIYYYEYADSNYGYRLYPNPPHASYINGKLLVEFRNNILMSHNKITELGEIYKYKKLNNIYTKNYINKTQKKYDVVIFLGSEHEYTAVDREICGLEWFGNDDFCKRVVDKYGKNIKYAIRCHPNSFIDINWTYQFEKLNKFLRKLEINYDIYGPDSSVDSYALLSENTIAAVEFSSISIDAVLMGRKVDIFADIDTKYLLESYENYSGNKNLQQFISEIFALNEFFLVKKFHILFIPFILMFCKIESVINRYKNKNKILC